MVQFNALVHLFVYTDESIIFFWTDVLSDGEYKSSLILIYVINFLLSLYFTFLFSVYLPRLLRTYKSVLFMKTGFYGPHIMDTTRGPLLFCG